MWEKMKKLDKKSLRIRFFVIVIVTLAGFTNNASAETLDSVSHIHHVKVVENKVLVLTHEGRSAHHTFFNCRKVRLSAPILAVHRGIVG